MNKYYTYRWAIQGELPDYLKDYKEENGGCKYIIIATNQKEADERFSYTLKGNWGSLLDKIKVVEFKEKKIEEDFIKYLDFNSIFNKSEKYYEVYDNNKRVFSCDNLIEAVYFMNNRCSSKSWIYDRNDEPFNISFRYGYELNL